MENKTTPHEGVPRVLNVQITLPIEHGGAGSGAFYEKLAAFVAEAGGTMTMADEDNLGIDNTATSEINEVVASIPGKEDLDKPLLSVLVAARATVRRENIGSVEDLADTLTNALGNIAVGDSAYHILTMPQVSRRYYETKLHHTTRMLLAYTCEEAMEKLDFSGSEKNIAHLVLSGLSNAEIAAALHYTEATVKGYVGAVLRRSDVTKRSGLASRLYFNGNGEDARLR